MTDRKSITIDEAAFDRLDAQKQDGESWPEFARRVADLLESQDGDDECTSSTVVVENVGEIARASADEVENRMTRR